MSFADYNQHLQNLLKHHIIPPPATVEIMTPEEITYTAYSGYDLNCVEGDVYSDDPDPIVNSETEDDESSSEDDDIIKLIRNIIGKSFHVLND
jgi:hypothetical protein